MFSHLAKSTRILSKYDLSRSIQKPFAAWFSSVEKFTGTVKWFDSKKGFGFIVPDDGSADVFVHQTSIHSAGFRSLADGESVEYSVHLDERGRKKADVVTGPMGAYVQGAPRSSFGDSGVAGFSSSGGFGGFGDDDGWEKDSFKSRDEDDTMMDELFSDDTSFDRETETDGDDKAQDQEQAEKF